FSKPEVQIVSVVPEFAITLNDAKERIRMLQEFVKEMMVPGQDYGIIPKCDKPSLFKPGAEKLCDIFGFSKHIEVVNRVEDWDKGLFHYEVKAILINKRTGHIEAEGVGSCNNREKKYSTSSPYNIINTLLKMAKKRAFIDAALSATKSSGLFSQDLENLEDFESSTSKEYAKSKQGPATTQHADSQFQKTRSQEVSKPVTKSQLNKIHALVTEKNIPVNKIKALINDRYKVPESKLMTLKQADDFIKYLINYNSK
ncbi:MAG: hypothetical protein AB7G87_12485, partial [Clostridia bacterium]